MSWEQDQEWERAWHKDCANSFAEEAKQYDYATKMGLDLYAYYENERKGFNFKDFTIVDIGGGPYSILLKSQAARRVVVDPCQYPHWTKVRYKECEIELHQVAGEDMKFRTKFDIALIYNVLQHVKDPKQVIEKARYYSKVIYIFEWLEVEPTNGHPHMLKEKELNEWLGGFGRVEHNPQGAWKGISYAGVFKS